MTAATVATAPAPVPARRRIARRIVVAAVLALQIAAIVAAYHNDHRVFGFQMFPEASRWRADIVRIDADGRRTPVDEDWEYRWADLVPNRGLARPATMSHADASLRSQLAYLQAALDWVATHTPDDRRTVRLEARVTAFHNGRGPIETTLSSPVRDPDRRPS